MKQLHFVRKSNTTEKRLVVEYNCYALSIEQPYEDSIPSVCLCVVCITLIKTSRYIIYYEPNMLYSVV